MERTGFGKGLFAEWRDDRDFVLNQPEYAGATILVAGPNFGTGSSREHAVWALMDYGFKAVISPRFGDIFRNNCTKAGPGPGQVDAETGAALLARGRGRPGAGGDRRRRAADWSSAPAAGIEAPFPLDAFTQHRLLEGLDDIGLTLRHADDIDAYERHRPAWMPSVLESEPGEAIGARFAWSVWSSGYER